MGVRSCDFAASSILSIASSADSGGVYRDCCFDEIAKIVLVDRLPVRMLLEVV
jgi:hypothetical protein